jgi:hypothetical protein
MKAMVWILELMGARYDIGKGVVAKELYFNGLSLSANV